MIEPTDDGWIRFSCPDRLWAGESAQDMLKLPPGFNHNMILEAVAATGWASEHDGQWRFQNSRHVRDLVQLLYEMLSYFQGPDEPSAELLRLKVQVDTILADEPGLTDGSELSPWHYARLDLLLRERLAETARTLDGVWEEHVQQLDTARIRSLVVRNFCRDLHAPSDRPAGQMAASSRTPAKVKVQGRTAG